MIHPPPIEVTQLHTRRSRATDHRRDRSVRSSRLLRPWHGFTLIELLVVISIIALLIALLLPALRQARDAAWAVRCLSNQRQMGVLAASYVSDYDGFYPQAWGPSQDAQSRWNWADQLAKQKGLSNFTELNPRDCPMMPEYAMSRGVSWYNRTAFAGYTWNMNLGYWAHAGAVPGQSKSVWQYGLVPHRQSDWPEASNVPVLHDGWGTSVTGTPDRWNDWHPNDPGAISKGRARLAPDIHNESANFLYLDGHAGAVRYMDSSQKYLDAMPWRFNG